MRNIRFLPALATLSCFVALAIEWYWASGFDGWIPPNAPIWDTPVLFQVLFIGGTVNFVIAVALAIIAVALFGLWHAFIATYGFFDDSIKG